MLNRQNGINFFPHLSEIRKFILRIKMLKIIGPAMYESAPPAVSGYAHDRLPQGREGFGEGFVGLQAVPMSSVRQLTVNDRALRIR
jgi:hypothetical protein